MHKINGGQRTVRANGFGIVSRGRDLIARATATAFLALAALMVLVSVPGLAHAQAAASPTPDTSSFIQYSALANQGKGEVNTAMGATAPVVIAIVVGMIGFYLLIRWINRAPKQS